MRRNRIIIAMLVLFLLTSGTFVLAKYTVNKTYVIAVKDEKYNLIPAPVVNPTSIKTDFTVTEVMKGYHDDDEVSWLGSDYRRYTYNPDSDTEVGTFVIQIWGGEGGSNHRDSNRLNNPGDGGYIVGLVQLKKGESIVISPGQWAYNGATGGLSDGKQAGGGDAGKKGNLADSGYGGGGRTIVKIGHVEVGGSTTVDVPAMVAGGGGGIGNVKAINCDAGDGGTLTGLNATDITSKLQSDEWYYFDGQAGNPSLGAGSGGSFGTNYEKNGTDYGGGGGDGMTAGEAGIQFVDGVNTLGTSGGGGSSAINAWEVQPIVTTSALMIKLSEKLTATGLDHPAAGLGDAARGGGYRIIQLVGANYDELSAIPLRN